MHADRPGHRHKQSAMSAATRWLWPAAVAVALAACHQMESSLPAKAQCLDSELPPIALPGGRVSIGSNMAYPEEAPERRVRLDGFNMDATEVTNAQFARFVAATGYVTRAERQPDPALIPKGAPAALFKPGAAVFKPPAPGHPQWWVYVPGANWRHPQGPGSSIRGRAHFPVVQIAYEDAMAYARWAGRALPTEAQWEYAASGGARTLYPWGNERSPEGREKANTWQGFFPLKDEAKDGFAGLAPVGCFEPNGFGLYDMIGNVWEWTATPFTKADGDTGTAEPVYTIKGGSFLCADNYCRRYRATARQPQEAGLGSNHIGFRTVSAQKRPRQ